MINPTQLGIASNESVLFVSDPRVGDVFVVLTSEQECEGAVLFAYFVINLDWSCYDEEPRVIRL